MERGGKREGEKDRENTAKHQKRSIQSEFIEIATLLGSDTSQIPSCQFFVSRAERARHRAERSVPQCSVKCGTFSSWRT